MHKQRQIRSAMQDQMQSFETYSKFASERNAAIRHKLSVDVQELKAQREQEERDAEESKRHVVAVAGCIPVNLAESDANEVLKVDLEKAKRSFLHHFASQLEIHEQKVRVNVGRLLLCVLVGYYHIRRLQKFNINTL